MSIGERLSAGGAGLASALAPLIGFARPDLAREIAARRAAAGELEAWGRERPGGPLLWLHGASAGELLGAAPTVRALRARRPFALAVTHFSPSGRAALELLEPDVAGYPPLDRPSDCARALEALRPDTLVFAKLDVWPGLVGAAVRAGVPTALINGVVRPGSGRLRAWARRAFRNAYRSLDAVGAATEADAERLVRLGARPERVRVTGDAAFDLASARADEARAADGWRERFEAALPARPTGGARLVAGSTWPPDETALLDALVELESRENLRYRWQVVLVPHEPGEAAVRRLLGACRARRQPAARWSRAEERARLPAHGIVVFDEVGRLAELYTAADAAWVGGALGGTGLHNVLEPAAAGVPVLFGPRHDRGDAAALEAAGGARRVEAGAIASVLERLADGAARSELGARARAFVASGAGAGDANAELIASIWRP